MGARVTNKGGYDVSELRERLTRETRRMGEFAEQLTPAPPFQPTAFPPNETKGGTESKFGFASIEETRTWGNSASLQFIATGAETVSIPSPQLIHIHRKRPTTYTILTSIDFGNGWVGEVGPFTLTLLITPGIGQAQRTIKVPLAIPGTDVVQSGQFSNVMQLPAHALQAQCVFSGAILFPGPHDVFVTMMAAPVFE
jgi:hypothetical protein